MHLIPVVWKKKQMINQHFSALKSYHAIHPVQHTRQQQHLGSSKAVYFNTPPSLLCQVKQNLCVKRLTFGILTSYY